MNSFLLPYSMVRLMITCATQMKLYYGKQCRSPQNAFVEHRVVIITILFLILVVILPINLNVNNNINNILNNNLNINNILLTCYYEPASCPS